MTTARRRTTAPITFEWLAELLGLEVDEYVITGRFDVERMVLLVAIESPQADPVPDGEEAPLVPLDWPRLGRVPTADLVEELEVRVVAAIEHANPNDVDLVAGLDAAELALTNLGEVLPVVEEALDP